MHRAEKVAYFSSEHGHEGLPLGGGLGILAGDAEKSAADLKLPMVAVGLLYRNGSFHQVLDAEGRQSQTYNTPFDRERLADYHKDTCTVPLQDRKVRISAGEFYVRSTVPGDKRNFVPLFLLEPTENGNGHDDTLADTLYPTDTYKKLCQQAILGYGGVHVLEHMGFGQLERYVLNEGHAALAINALLERYGGDIDKVRAHVFFVTHTPVPAGIDVFTDFDIKNAIPHLPFVSEAVSRGGDNSLHMMKYAMGTARPGSSVAVARLHELVSKAQFYQFPNMDALGSIDNGVHLPTWTSPEVQQLYDKYTNGVWRTDPKTLELGLLSVKTDEVEQAHSASRGRLGQFLKDNLGQRVRGNAEYDPGRLTIGFGRRFATYKQATLIFDQMTRLEMLGDNIQLVFSGKAHEADDPGKAVISDLFMKMAYLRGKVPIFFIEDYDMAVAKLIVQGADVWLNNPRKLREASGTSGMKAAANFVPQISIPDGWWILQQAPEGYRLPKGLVEGVTGWGIGEEPTGEYIARITDLSKTGNFQALEAVRSKERIDAANLFMDKLAEVVVPLFRSDKDTWRKIGRSAAAFNASWYNTHRMILQYFERMGVDVPQLDLLSN
ncbi:MAG TPA: alpha-glucan family phosphorylase [Candidatus Nanoarchaeia archaeon]|nr:alpha-glucan family phosphorylase [Candidatus Nanoarchaeia archaeon]